MEEKILSNKQDLVNVADSIRAKLGTIDKYYVSELSGAIDSIKTKSETSDTAIQPSKSITITSNGTVSITPDSPYDAMSNVDLTVSVESDLIAYSFCKDYSLTGEAFLFATPYIPSGIPSDLTKLKAFSMLNVSDFSDSAIQYLYINNIDFPSVGSVSSKDGWIGGVDLGFKSRTFGFTNRISSGTPIQMISHTGIQGVNYVGTYLITLYYSN